MQGRIPLLRALKAFSLFKSYAQCGIIIIEPIKGNLDALN